MVLFRGVDASEELEIRKLNLSESGCSVSVLARSSKVYRLFQSDTGTCCFGSEIARWLRLQTLVSCDTCLRVQMP